RRSRRRGWKKPATCSSILGLIRGSGSSPTRGAISRLWVTGYRTSWIIGYHRQTLACPKPLHEDVLACGLCAWRAERSSALAAFSKSFPVQRLRWGEEGFWRAWRTASEVGLGGEVMLRGGTKPAPVMKRRSSGRRYMSLPLG